MKRSSAIISEELERLVDVVWYNRCYMQLLESQEWKNVRADIWEGAKRSAMRIENTYTEDELGPFTDFEWGMINGKLSALRWIGGDEWDMLDT